MVCIAGVSHSAFTRLLDHWWTNSFGSDIFWTQMTGRRHDRGSNGILASKCWLTAVFDGERPQVTIVCILLQNPVCLAVLEEKLTQMINLATFMLLPICYFWLENILNIAPCTKIPTDLTKTDGRTHFSVLNILIITIFMAAFTKIILIVKNITKRVYLNEDKKYVA